MANQVLSSVLNPEAQRTPASEGSGAGAPSWSMASRLDTLDVELSYLGHLLELPLEFLVN